MGPSGLLWGPRGHLLGASELLIRPIGFVMGPIRHLMGPSGLLLASYCVLVDS